MSVFRLRRASEKAADHAQEHHDGEGDPIADLGRCMVGVGSDVVEESLECPGHESGHQKPYTADEQKSKDPHEAERENLENLVHDTNPL